MTEKNEEKKDRKVHTYPPRVLISRTEETSVVAVSFILPYSSLFIAIRA